MSNSVKTVGCAVLTHNGQSHITNCLKPLLESPLNPRIVVIDSSSIDGTVDLVHECGVEIVVIPQSDFNHGMTREFARKYLGTDIICMFTQDAYLHHPAALERLVSPIIKEQASITYARQIPHRGADFFEAFARDYNYPTSGHIRGIEDLKKYGVYTFFCSNSCAGYSNKALEEIGGFEEVLLGEDTVATAKLLRKGHKIAYVAEALVNHSHRYSLLQEFQRNFDTGLARASYADLLKCDDGDAKRGMNYVRELFITLAKKSPHLLPYACVHILSKWSGYQVGKRSVNAPLWFKRGLSSQKFYWTDKSKS